MTCIAKQHGKKHDEKSKQTRKVNTLLLGQEKAELHSRWPSKDQKFHIFLRPHLFAPMVSVFAHFLLDGHVRSRNVIQS